ncbi:beta strand repeat-containing protein [Methanosphaera sp.]
MNKNIKVLFILTTILVLFVVIFPVSATDNMTNSSNTEIVNYTSITSTKQIEITDNTIDKTLKENQQETNENYNTTNKKNTHLTVNEAMDSVSFGEIEVITGVLSDENNNVLADKTITIKTDKLDVNVTTNNNGIYTYNYISNNVTTVIVTVLFEGDDAYNPTQNETWFDVEPMPTTLTLDTEQTITITENITLTGQLLDKNGNGISNQTITLNLNNKPVDLTTDITGSYNYTTIPTTTGLITLNVHFNRTTQYTEAYNETIIDISKVNTILSITKYRNTLTAGDNITINGTLTDEYDTTIPNATIQLVIKNNTINITTNNNGVYSYNYTTTKSDKIVISVRYNGDNKYSKSENTTEIDIEQKVSYIELNGIFNQEIYNNVEIQGRLLNIYTSEVLANQTINLTINNKTYNLTTNNRGVFNTTVYLTEIGTYYVQVTYTGNITYTGYRTNTTFTSSGLVDVYVNSNARGTGKTRSNPTNMTNALKIVTSNGIIHLVTINDETIDTYTTPLTINSKTTPNKSIEIWGDPGMTIIFNGLYKNQMVSIASGYNVSMRNIVFRNGNATSGGAIINKGNLTLTNTTIKENTARYGGAILNEGNLTLTNNTIINNSALNSGGVINSKGYITLKYNNFTNNSAAFGGAIYSSGNATITNTNYFIANHVTKNGGAIYNFGVMNLRNNNFTSNTADQWSGAVHNARNITVVSNKFALNTAGQLGGAMFNNANGTLTSNTFEYNRGKYGGAIYNGGVVTIEKNTIRYNNASQTGGAVANKGIVTLKSNKMTGNKAVYGGAIYSNNTVTETGDIITYCVASKSGGAIYNIGNFTVKSSNFTGNKANNGGTIFNARSMNITSNNIVTGNASLGGGLYNDGTTCNVVGNNFTKNNANYGGAAFTKVAIKESGNKYTNNTAIKGPDVYPN